MPLVPAVALQTAGLRGISASRLHRVLPPVGRGVIFAGHRVAPDNPDSFDPNRALSITPAFLDALLGHLEVRGIPVVPLSEVMERLRARTPGFFACFTFDDGYADNHLHALPIFRRHAAPLAVYLTSGLVDGSVEPWWAVLEDGLRRAEEVRLVLDGEPRRWSLTCDGDRDRAYAEIAAVLNRATAEEIREVLDRLREQVGHAASSMPMLTPSMLAEMAADELVELGAHTVHHVRLATQTPDRVERELVGSREAVESLTGRPVTHLAYPYGNASSYGDREQRLARRLRFETAVTTRKALMTRGDLDHPFELPRVSLNGHFQDLELIDVLLSGLPFAAEHLRRATRRRPGSAHDG